MVGFPGGSGVNNQPALQESQEIQVPSLGPENPLEEGIATTPVFLPGESHGQVGGQQSVVTKSQTWLKNLAHVPCYGFAFLYTDLSVLHFVFLGQWGARGLLLVPFFFYSDIMTLVLYKLVLLSI